MCMLKTLKKKSAIQLLDFQNILYIVMSIFLVRVVATYYKLELSKL